MGLISGRLLDSSPNEGFDFTKRVFECSGIVERQSWHSFEMQAQYARVTVAEEILGLRVRAGRVARDRQFEGSADFNDPVGDWYRRIDGAFGGGKQAPPALCWDFRAVNGFRVRAWITVRDDDSSSANPPTHAPD